MLLKFLYRQLAFDGRAEPLDHERDAAQMATQIWGDELPQCVFRSPEASGDPPLVYAQSWLSTPHGSPSQPQGPAADGGSSSVLRDLAEGMLTRSMPVDVQHLLEDARSYSRERRVVGREPYMHPALLKLSAADDHRHAAFIRDVSVGGLGLLHFVPLPQRRIIVSTRRRNDQIICLQVDIVWCIPCGEGCYMSGGAFVAPWTRVEGRS
jgi:hypothetical protein